MHVFGACILVVLLLFVGVEEEGERKEGRGGIADKCATSNRQSTDSDGGHEATT